MNTYNSLKGIRIVQANGKPVALLNESQPIDWRTLCTFLEPRNDWNFDFWKGYGILTTETSLFKANREGSEVKRIIKEHNIQEFYWNVIENNWITKDFD